jgi:hypothetical protein
MDSSRLTTLKKLLIVLKIKLILQVRLLTVVVITDTIRFIFFSIFVLAGIMMWDAGDAKRNNNYGQQIRDKCLS